MREMSSKESEPMYSREDVERILQTLLLEIAGNHYNNASNIEEKAHNNATEDAANEVRKALLSLLKED